NDDLLFIHEEIERGARVRDDGVARQRTKGPLRRDRTDVLKNSLQPTVDIASAEGDTLEFTFCPEGEFVFVAHASARSKTTTAATCESANSPKRRAGVVEYVRR